MYMNHLVEERSKMRGFWGKLGFCYITTARVSSRCTKRSFASRRFVALFVFFSLLDFLLQVVDQATSRSYILRDRRGCYESVGGCGISSENLIRCITLKNSTCFRHLIYNHTFFTQYIAILQGKKNL